MRIPHKGGIFIEKVIKSKAAEASFSSCCCHPPKPSVTRWQYIFQYLAIYNNEQVPNSIKIAKLGSKCCQGLLNKPFKNCQRCYFCCHSGGEILPNLVTLVTHPTHTKHSGIQYHPWLLLPPLLLFFFFACSITLFCDSLPADFLP